MGLIMDPLLCLAGDDNINAMHPCVGRVLLSNPVTWVKETGTAGANVKKYGYGSWVDVMAMAGEVTQQSPTSKLWV